MTEVQNSGVSRRRIIQGAAWATPAIVIAAAAPAAASSTSVDIASFTAANKNVTMYLNVPRRNTTYSVTVTLTWSPSEFDGTLAADAPHTTSGSSWTRSSFNKTSASFTLTIGTGVGTINTESLVVIFPTTGFKKPTAVVTAVVSNSGGYPNGGSASGTV